jgi:hypothetical protein
MTVSKVPYFSWSGSGINSNVPPYNSCSPNLLSIQDYCRRRWGVTSLGCHVPPPASTHSHPYGAANDLRFNGRGPTLEAIDFLIAWSAELGVNTIHDYFDHQRMWKPLVGWTYNAPIGSPGGQWIHVETTPAAFGDGRPVEDKLTGSSQGDDFMTPEDQKYLDAKFAALAKDVWAQVLKGRFGFPDDLAEHYLVDARAEAGYLQQNVANLNGKVDKLVTKVDALALTAGDAAALKAAITEIVRNVLNDTVLEVRPPS